MARLVRAIHVFFFLTAKTWMPRMKRGMTIQYPKCVTLGFLIFCRSHKIHCHPGLVPGSRATGSEPAAPGPRDEPGVTLRKVYSARVIT